MEGVTRVKEDFRKLLIVFIKGDKMLADVIVEEEFDKEQELWYSRRELEHGEMLLNCNLHVCIFIHTYICH